MLVDELDLIPFAFLSVREFLSVGSLGYQEIREAGGTESHRCAPAGCWLYAGRGCYGARSAHTSLSVPLHLFLDHLCMLICLLPKRRGRGRNPEVKLNETPALIILFVSLNI